MSSPVHISSVPRDSGDEALKAAIKRVLLESTNNLSWLAPGELVLLKPAINSPDPYPSTTHPFSVSVVADTIKEYGGRVIVGDQSGIEHVVHGPKGVIKGESKKNFEKSGMGDANNADFVSFEQDGWNEGFSRFESEKTMSWKNGFYATNWIQKADHIINLPRVSTHAQAGVTLGFKNLVGLLREDSRLEFHANGPFNSFIASAAKGSGLESKDDGMNRFIEKIVEISLAIQHKLRLTLFTATKAQTTFGPDHHVVPFITSYVAAPKNGLVFASDDPVAAECFAIAYLTELYKNETPLANKIQQKALIFANRRIKELGTQPIADQPLIKHAVKLGLGSAEIEAVYTNTPEELKVKLDAGL